MLAAIVFVAACAFANRVRGGALDDRLGIDGNTGIRVASAGIVGLAAVFTVVADKPLLSLVIAAAFFLFHLPGWGAWFDFTDLPQPRRGSGPPQWAYDAIAPRHSPYTAKWAAMIVRGLYIVILFAPLAWWSGWWVLLLALPYAALWALAYCGWHRWGWPVHAEVSTGALFGLAVIIAL